MQGFMRGFMRGLNRVAKGIGKASKLVKEDAKKHPIAAIGVTTTTVGGLAGFGYKIIQDKKHEYSDMFDSGIKADKANLKIAKQKLKKQKEKFRPEVYPADITELDMDQDDDYLMDQDEEDQINPTAIAEMERDLPLAQNAIIYKRDSFLEQRRLKKKVDNLLKSERYPTTRAVVPLKQKQMSENEKKLSEIFNERLSSHETSLKPERK